MDCQQLISPSGQTPAHRTWPMWVREWDNKGTVSVGKVLSFPCFLPKFWWIVVTKETTRTEVYNSQGQCPWGLWRGIIWPGRVYSIHICAWELLKASVYFGHKLGPPHPTEITNDSETTFHFMYFVPKHHLF